MTGLLSLLMLVAAAAAGDGPRAPDLATARVVDLSHAFDKDTLYWPTAPSTFELKQLAHGPTPGGWFYAANSFCTPEHGGTHLDAPIHFHDARRTLDQVPVRQLIGPAVVVDVGAKAAAEPDYQLTRADLDAWEARNGAIPRGALVLLRTGWSARWPDRKRYLGDDTPGDASRLHFPSFGRDAAQWLVQTRQVGALGVDTASIDVGASKDFIVHQVAAAAEVPGLENLTNLDQLPERGAWVVALPMKIAGGSGGPLRAVALLPDSGGAPHAEWPERKLRLADGLDMAYVEAGGGEPALVFIHCGNCRKEIWAETLDAFQGTHRVVAMDLAGHGHSGANRASWSLPALGADVAALADHLKLKEMILVGNSLGGPVALEAARRLGPSRVLGIVAVDTLQDVEAVWPKDALRRQLLAYRSDFQGACTQAMLRLLPEDAPAATRERIDRDTCDDDPRAFSALFETLGDYDDGAAMRAAGVPIWAINATRFPTAVETNRKYARSFDVILMEGVGHYPQVERPQEFQQHLRRVIQSLNVRSLHE
jgi:kynurenine formamidase/pimeloyl-ACP methyl ester carboxylesterase